MLFPIEARYPTLHEEVVAVFSDLQLEYVACEACGQEHPPELHLSAIPPFEPDEPEEG